MNHLERVCALMALLIQAPAAGQDSPTVGMPARMDQIVLPGTELVVMPPRDRDQPLVLRISESYPHGNSYRYDIVYYALEPGTYDLRDYLQRRDGSGTADLPSIPVTVRAGLPPGQIEPSAPARPRRPRLGGYETLLKAAGALWLAGLVILFLRARRRRVVAEQAKTNPPPTLAERLEPLVMSARAGTLQPAQRAELERLLIGFWTDRLELKDLAPAQALARLRNHQEVGVLIQQLEAWLHRPGGSEPVDLVAMLAPYAQANCEGKTQKVVSRQPQGSKP